MCSKHKKFKATLYCASSNFLRDHCALSGICGSGYLWFPKSSVPKTFACSFLSKLFLLVKNNPYNKIIAVPELFRIHTPLPTNPENATNDIVTIS